MNASPHHPQCFRCFALGLLLPSQPVPIHGSLVCPPPPTHPAAAAAATLRAALCWCLQAERPNLLAGMAAAQQADIFVGSHGANLANAWFMRPGSSVLELTMFGWEEHGHMALAKRNSQVRCRRGLV